MKIHGTVNETGLWVTMSQSKRDRKVVGLAFCYVEDCIKRRSITPWSTVQTCNRYVCTPMLPALHWLGQTGQAWVPGLLLVKIRVMMENRHRKKIANQRKTHMNMKAEWKRILSTGRSCAIQTFSAPCHYRGVHTRASKGRNQINSWLRLRIIGVVLLIIELPKCGDVLSGDTTSQKRQKYRWCTSGHLDMGSPHQDQSLQCLAARCSFHVLLLELPCCPCWSTWFWRELKRCWKWLFISWIAHAAHGQQSHRSKRRQFDLEL